MSSGNLFHYFPSKRAIFIAIFEEDGRDAAAHLAEVADSDDPWGEVLGVVAMMVAQAADPEYVGLAHAIFEQANRDEDFAALVARNDREMREGLAGLLDRAASKGQIEGIVDSATAATWVVALMDAMFIRAGDPDFSPAEQAPTLRLILTRFLNAEAR